MPEVDISSRVYDRLLQRTVSFNDTPDDVIKRLLDEVEGAEPSPNPTGRSHEARRGTPPAAPGSILPISEYWVPILSTLAEAGGSAPASEVIDALEERMAGSFKGRDRDTLRNGEIRWRNRARFARLRMKERGLLSDTSPRGIWEITDSGQAYLESAVRPGV
jgi:hypothetical protein